MSHHCPECQQELYSRRLKNCGFCGAPIPESLRFTAEEAAARDEEIEKSNERFRERERVAAEEEAARRRDRGHNGIDPFGLF